MAPERKPIETLREALHRIHHVATCTPRGSIAQQRNEVAAALATEKAISADLRKQLDAAFGRAP